MSHLSDIGFGFDNAEEFERFVQQVVNLEGNIGFVAPNGHYILWEGGDGVELWIHGDANMQLSGCGIHFRGRSVMRACATQTFVSGDSPLHGCLYAWLDPQDENNPYSGLGPFAATVPNFDYVEAPLLKNPMVSLQVAAFVEGEMRCYMSDGAYLSVEGRAATPPEIFRPDWDDSASSQPPARAICGGHVLAVNALTNRSSQLPFLHLLVKTQGGTIDMLADPEAVRGKPVVGGIVQAACWLSAAVLTDLPRPAVFAEPAPMFRQKREARAKSRSTA